MNWIHRELIQHLKYLLALDVLSHNMKEYFINFITFIKS